MLCKPVQALEFPTYHVFQSILPQIHQADMALGVETNIEDNVGSCFLATGRLPRNGFGEISQCTSEQDLGVRLANASKLCCAYL